MVGTNGKFINGDGKEYRKNGFKNCKDREVGTFTEEPFLKPRITEKSLAGILFLITVLILIGKLTFMLKSSLQSLLQWKELVREMLTDPTSGREFFTFHWESGFRGEFLMWPLTCGLVAFLFTWFIVYFDSRIPGVDPPLPSVGFFLTGINSKSGRFQKKSMGWPLAYKTSILTGLLTFSVILFSRHL
ncbi:hypothetical protein DMENIID0001_020690 [Sergentomyia squamirostris]